MIEEPGVTANTIGQELIGSEIQFALINLPAQAMNYQGQAKVGIIDPIILRLIHFQYLNRRVAGPDIGVITKIDPIGAVTLHIDQIVLIDK